jgi:CheY-like chemotaxis protein
VLMDLQMPVLDGLQATREIRSNPQLAAMPIIAMTAHAMLEERDRCLAAGMVDHITKPLDPAVMFKTLARWIHTRSAMPPVHALLAAPTSAGPAAPAPELPHVPELDSAAGLARVGGNRSLYLRLLHQFIDKQADADQRCAAALAVGDMATAERIVHTVRGVAGNIGLTGVQQSAAMLEHALRQRGESGPAAAAFRAELARAIAALQSALGAKSHEEAAVPPGQAGPIVARLAVLMAASDGEAGDYFRAHRPILLHAVGTEATAQIEAALDDYEFEQALSVLRGATVTQVTLGTPG